MNEKSSDITTLIIHSTPQPQQHARALSTILPPISTRQVSNIGVPRQRLRDILASIDPPNLNQPVPSLRHGLTDDIRALSLTLRTDNVRLTLLLCTLDDESCSFSVLLGDLLLLDGTGEFLAEGHVGDRDVFQSDVELRCALQQVRADTVRDGFSLRDEFGCVELGHDGF